MNRLVLYDPEHEPLVKRGEDAAVNIPASVEHTGTPSTKDKENKGTDNEQANDEENKTQKTEQKKNKEETKNKNESELSGELADVDDDDNSGNGDGSTREHPEENVDERAPQLEVEPITTPRRGTRSQTARNEKEQRRA